MNIDAKLKKEKLKLSSSAVNIPSNLEVSSRQNRHWYQGTSLRFNMCSLKFWIFILPLGWTSFTHLAIGFWNQFLIFIKLFNVLNIIVTNRSVVLVNFIVPHMIVEYLANFENRIDIDVLCDSLWWVLKSNPIFTLGGIRVRV